MPTATSTAAPQGASRALAELRDSDGYAAIADYGVLGDGRGCALVATDGAVDWWAVPRVDSTPPFAALLDPERGGRIELRPSGKDVSATRRYLPHTNILQTTYTTPTGSVTVTDSLNSGSAGALPWSELARRVECIEGSVAMTFAAVPGDGLRAWEPWAEQDDHSPVMHAGTVTLGVRCSPEITLKTSHDRVQASFTIKAGERRILALVASDDDPLFLCEVDSIDHRIDLTASSWRTWTSQVQWDGAGREQIVRSAWP